MTNTNTTHRPLPASLANAIRTTRTDVLLPGRRVLVDGAWDAEVRSLDADGTYTVASWQASTQTERVDSGWDRARLETLSDDPSSRW